MKRVAHSSNGLFLSCLRGQKGAVAIMVALALPMLIAVVAFAIEYSQYLKIKTETQGALDQALLAAASYEKDDFTRNRRQVTRDFFYSNISPEFKEYLVETRVDNIDVTLPTGSQPMIISGDGTAVFRTSGFGSYIGFDELTIEVSSTVTRNIRNIETIVLLPKIGTFCATSNEGEAIGDTVADDYSLTVSPNFKCARYNGMRAGVRHYIDTIDEMSNVADFKVGLVPYNYKVNLGSTKIPPELAHIESAEFYERVGEARPLEPVLPLTSDLKRAKSMMLDIESPYEEDRDRQNSAWSRTDLPTMVAGMMFDPAHFKKVGGTERPMNFSAISKWDEKVLILITDGSNFGCCFTNYPDGNFDNQYLYTYEPYHKKMRELCRLLKEEGVTIYSILIDIDTSTPAGAYINKTFSICASGAGLAGKNENAICENKNDYCFEVLKVDDNETKVARSLVSIFDEITGRFILPQISE